MTVAYDCHVRLCNACARYTCFKIVRQFACRAPEFNLHKTICTAIETVTTIIMIIRMAMAVYGNNNDDVQIRAHSFKFEKHVSHDLQSIFSFECK